MEEIRDETAPTALVGARPCELAATAFSTESLVTRHPKIAPTFTATGFRCRRRVRDALGTPASAPPWAPGPRRRPASTSPSPSSSTRRPPIRRAVGSEWGPRCSGLALRRATDDDDASARSSSSGAVAPYGPDARHRRPARHCWRAISSTPAGTTSPTAAWLAATARSSAPRASVPPSGHDRPCGHRGARPRTWASCFDLAHSYLHGGPVRADDPGPLPAVADPQALDLVGPVRHVGMRGLRTLHHLVPGRHRPHRGGSGDPGQRRGCTHGAPRSQRPVRQGGDRERGACRRRPVACLRTIADLVAEHPLLPASPATPCPGGGLRQERRRRGRPLLLVEGETGRHCCTCCGGAGGPRGARVPGGARSLSRPSARATSWGGRGCSPLTVALRRTGTRARRRDGRRRRLPAVARPTPTRSSATPSCSGSRR